MEESPPPKRFKDFAREHVPLDGQKLKIADILDCERYSELNSGGCMTLSHILHGGTMTRHTDKGDENFDRNGDMMRKIITGVVIIFISSWVGYISVRGLNTNDALSVVKMDVEVVKTKQIAIERDITEIKELSRAIRDDQIRRYKQNK